MIRSLLLVSGRMYGGGQRVVMDLLEESRSWIDGSVDLCFLGGPFFTTPPVCAEVVEYDGRYNRPSTLWTTSRRLRGVIRHLKPDLLHSHGWDAAAIGALALVAAPIPHLVHFHTTDSWLESDRARHRLRRSLTRWVRNRPRTTVVTVSDAVRQHWSRTVGWPSRSIRVIHNGVDTERFQPSHRAQLSSEQLTLGAASRLEPAKGLEELLGALRLLALENLRPNLFVAGEGSLRTTLERQVTEMGLQHQVRFVGFLSNMERFYSSIDVGVLPSFTEGLPLFVLEAMASGVPVVATDVGGTKEALRDGIDGFLVPAKDSAALANAIRKLLSPDRRVEMGVNARSNIIRDFSLTRSFHGVSALYRETLAQATNGDFERANRTGGAIV